MSRLRPVHNLSAEESALAIAMRDEKSGADEMAVNLRLKEKIETYWRERGQEVEIKILRGGFNAALREGRVDLRSDMVNGFPTKRADDDERPSPSRRGLMEVA